MNLMRTHIAKTSGAAALLGLLTALPAAAAPITFSVGGTDQTSSIQATVDGFRAALGNPNNGNGAGTTGGRREINWDGGGNTNTSTGTPLTAFLNIRGAQFDTGGTGFLQAPPSGTAPVGMNNFFNNATYGTIFSVFSSPRDFTPVGSNITDVHFFIPGTNGGTPAAVSGFGAVFTDVDLADATKIDFFDKNGDFLASRSVPTGTGNASLSFLGVSFNAGEQIFSVRITSGTNPLAPGTNDDPAEGIDLVVMDDFLFQLNPRRWRRPCPSPPVWRCSESP